MIRSMIKREEGFCQHQMRSFASEPLRGPWRQTGRRQPLCSLRAFRQLRMSSAMVIGPTPPGTGVMMEA